MDSELVLKVEALSKKNNQKQLFRNLSLDLKTKEWLGICGPKGSGKTSLVHMISGLDPHYDGTIQRLTKKKKIGIVFEKPTFYKDQTGLCNLKIFSKVSGVRSKKELKAVIKACGLEDVIHKSLDTYDEEDLQRLNLGQALLGHPEIMLLDEPFKDHCQSGSSDFIRLLDQTCKEKSVVVFSQNERALKALCHRMIKI